MYSNRDTVLLVAAGGDDVLPILAKLFDHGYSVVGPVSTGAVAMAVAAHTFPTLALMVSPPAGRRTANEVARDLMTTWGIRSLVLDGALEPGAKVAPDVDWALRPGQAARLHSVLDDGDAAVDDARWYGDGALSAGSDASVPAETRLDELATAA